MTGFLGLSLRGYSRGFRVSLMAAGSFEETKNPNISAAVPNGNAEVLAKSTSGLTFRKGGIGWMFLMD